MRYQGEKAVFAGKDTAKTVMHSAQPEMYTVTTAGSPITQSAIQSVFNDQRLFICSRE